MKKILKLEPYTHVEWFQKYFDKHWDELDPGEDCEIIGPDGLIYIYEKMIDDEGDSYYFLWYCFPGGVYAQMNGETYGTLDGLRFYADHE